ncbi:hypothetical protein [Symbioplanes lichenis]|uniref:hypothetical protein n=1 Tax=Symbioplanes lichenis TaxID=1629072 RepID=UPI0027398370|nr:hypothetical protein [Actinoplanes lichenis]
MRLDDALRIPGAYAVALIAADGPALTWWGRTPTDDQARAAAGVGRSAADLVRLGAADQSVDDTLDDVLITSASAFHVLRLLPGEGEAGRVAHLMLRRAGANLAMARHDFRRLTAAYVASSAPAAPTVRASAAVVPAPAAPVSAAPVSVAPLSAAPVSAAPVSAAPALVEDEPGSAPRHAAEVEDEVSVVAEEESGEPDETGEPGLRTGEQPAPGLEPDALTEEDRVAEPQPEAAEEPGEGKKPLLPRREPRTDKIPPAAVTATATPAAWLDLLGQPYLNDETVLERVLGSLKQL